MDPGNVLCWGCRCNVAKFFCPCTKPETVLCEGCLGKHMSQGLVLAHQIRPLATLAYSKNPRALERLTGLSRVREEAQQSYGEVDRAIAELYAKVQETIEALQALYWEKVAQLQEIKTTLAREIQLGLDEVERTVAEERPLLTTQFGPLFRRCTEKTVPLKLFYYTIESCSALALLCFNFKLATFQEPTRLAGVYNDQAFLYDVKTQQITKHTLSHNFGRGGSYVELDKDTLLCVGANPASYSVPCPPSPLPDVMQE